MTRFRSSASPEGAHSYFVTGLSDDHFITPDNSCFPLRLRYIPEKPKGKSADIDWVGEQSVEPISTANLSEIARTYLTQVGIKNPDADAETAGLIWMHALAVGYSPVYLEENADGIRQDWPRIPLPSQKRALLDSAALGLRVAALLDTENPVDGVTSGKIDPRLKSLGVIRKVGGGALDPDAGELDLTAGWGHAGARGVCMPGRGKVEERVPKDKEENDLPRDTTLDVYLNGTAFWSNVPQAVWGYTIGGYQVIKKWLSYREKAMLGRGLTMEEAEYVTEMVRRIAALILLQPNLDENYETVKAETWPWPAG